MQEYWQITEERGTQTIGVWGQFDATFKVKKLTLADHTADVNGLPGLAQARDTKQTTLDGIAKIRDNALEFIRDIIVRVPHVIENNLDPDDELVGDLNTVYAIHVGISEASDLNRARKVVALWGSVNAARLAMVPPLAAIAIKRAGGGADVALAEFSTTVAGYQALQQNVANADTKLSEAKSALRTQTLRADKNNKRWYAAWETTFPEGSPEHDALSTITTETGTSAPNALEIATLTVAALSVQVAYVPDGGAHATTLELQTRIHGTETDFGHSVPVVATGQTVGPFASGAVVDFRTRAANSAGVTFGTIKTATVM